MRLRDEGPHFRAMCKDSSGWLLPEGLLADFLAHWTTSKPFWHGRDVWDQPVVIKLGDVTGVIHRTQAAIDLHDTEEQEYRTRAMLAGDVQ